MGRSASVADDDECTSPAASSERVKTCDNHVTIKSSIQQCRLCDYEYVRV